MKFEFTDEELEAINEQHRSQGSQSLPKLDEEVKDASPSEDREDDESGTQSDTEESTDRPVRMKAWKEGNEEYQ